MEWIYKQIWELKSKALTKENKERIQKLQQLLDGETESNDSTSNDSEKDDKNNSAKNSSKDSSIKKEEEEIHKFLYNRYNR